MSLSTSKYLAGVRRPRGAGAHQFAGERGRVLFDGRRVRLREVDVFTPAARPGKADSRGNHLDGQPLAAEPTAAAAWCFSVIRFSPTLNVLDNVAIGLELPASPLFGPAVCRQKRDARNAQRMLEKVGLGHALNKYPAQLSGGMQQRLAIARLSCSRAYCCLMNPSARWIPVFEGYARAVAQLWSETRMTVLMVTHDLARGFNLGTRLS